MLFYLKTWRKQSFFLILQFIDDQNEYYSYVERNKHVIASSCDDEERKRRIDPCVKKTYHNGFELLENFDSVGDNFSYVSESLLGAKGTNSNECMGSNTILPNQQIEVKVHQKYYMQS